MTFKPLRNEQIETFANELLVDFGLDEWMSQGFVDVEDMVELHYGITPEYFAASDMPCAAEGLVLGFLDVHKERIGINDSLLPENGGNEGRFRFTLAHELGHLVLHRDQIIKNGAQLSCFEDVQSQHYLMKTINSKPIEEQQADKFASYLLMPQALVMNGWKEFTGSHSAMSFMQVRMKLAPTMQSGKSDHEAVAAYAAPLAKKLKVSKAALAWRLQGIGLVSKTPQIALDV